MSFGVWRIYLGPTGINIGIIILGLIVLVLAIAKKLRRTQTSIFLLRENANIPLKT